MSQSQSLSFSYVCSTGCVRRKERILLSTPMVFFPLTLSALISSHFSLGYVLDGIPKTTAQAKDVFGSGEEVDHAIMPGGCPICVECVYDLRENS